MDSERWRRIEDLYEAAVALEPDRRAAFLDESCSGEESLRREVESLLLHERTASRFLEVPEPLASGQRVSHYEIQQKLGSGGMGAVYRAYDSQLRRHVAIKVLALGYLSDDERRTRLLREARAASALNHPNIVGIYEVGSDRGLDFISMEFVEGKTLKDIISSTGLPLAETLDYAAQIASGLAKAHATGIVHGDLKPANIMVSSDGIVKLLDFGLARRMLVTTAETASFTAQDEIAGTPAYMSPEQARGEEIDSRTDLFSLGAVLYEMVTGSRAFSAASPAVVLHNVLAEQPTPVSKVNPAVPARLESVINKALEKDRARRYQTAAELRTDLDLLEQGKETLRTAASQRGARLWSLGATVAVLFLLAVIFLLNLGGLKDRLVSRPSLPTLNPKRVAIAIFDNRTGDPSLDNLGRMAAESVSQGLLQINTMEIVPSSRVFEIAGSGTGPNHGRDLVRDLAETTSSGLVVSGAVYQQGQTLEVRTTITDEIANKPLWPIEPADGTRDNAAQIVAVVAQRVTDAVAARYLNPYFNLLAEEERAPRLEAQKEFASGLELFYSNPSAAIVHVRHAAEIDHAFVLPRYLLAYSINNSGKIAEAVAQLDAIEKTQNLTALQRRHIEWLRANIDGRSEEVYSIARDIVRRVPEEHINSIDVALGASWSNRPREAVENFKTLRGPPFFTPSNTMGLLFLQQWTDALHLLGDHEEELQEARWGKSLYPHLFNAYACEVRALVALGKVEEADKLIDDILAMPSTWSYTSYGTPGYVMLSAAEELRTHDHRDAALRMASRAVDWYRSRVGKQAKDEDTRSNLGEALYRAERWQEADAVFRALSAEHPGNISYQGRLGTLAARRGDRARALQIAETLRRNETPYLYGNHTFRSARIIALLGEKERAVALLRDAVAQGSGTAEESDSYGYGFIYSHSMDLESLRGYPPFEELIKPKD